VEIGDLTCISVNGNIKAFEAENVGLLHKPFNTQTIVVINIF
jgi:phosphopantothenate synthetase